MKTDGSNKTVISNDIVGTFVILNGWIYYTNLSEKLFRMKLDGTSSTALTDTSISSFSITGNAIAYSGSGPNLRFFKMNSDGSAKTKINDAGGSSIHTIAYTNYFINSNDNKLYKVNIDGNGLTKLNVDRTNFAVSIVGDWIYYRNEGYNFRAYKIRTDNS